MLHARSSHHRAFALRTRRLFGRRFCLVSLLYHTLLSSSSSCSRAGVHRNVLPWLPITEIWSQHRFQLLLLGRHNHVRADYSKTTNALGLNSTTRAGSSSCRSNKRPPLSSLTLRTKLSAEHGQPAAHTQSQFSNRLGRVVHCEMLFFCFVIDSRNLSIQQSSRTL